MSGTVYLKIEKNVQIHSRIVSFKDIAQIVADDSALETKIRVLKLPPDTVQGPGRYPISVMTLIELIQQEFPGIEVNNIGEADFILTLEKKKQPGGLYAWCKTALVALIAFFGAAGFGDPVMAVTSSHFGGAEKQFRFPLEYGNQRPLSATWTVTGAGAFLLSKKGGRVRIPEVTIGKVVDYGVKDSLNMGACMAPAAADTIERNLEDLGREPEDYDRIITGDLGYVGKQILLDLLKGRGIDIKEQHMDCGIEIFDRESQDTHSGGSGCGCSAVTLAALILPKLTSGEWKRVLFVPTGALLSTVSYNEGQSVPGIAHGVVLEHC